MEYALEGGGSRSCGTRWKDPFTFILARGFLILLAIERSEITLVKRCSKRGLKLCVINLGTLCIIADVS